LSGGTPNKSKLIWASVFTLWIAAGLQQGVGAMATIFGISPDYLVVAVSVLSLYGNSRSGMVVGFFGGLLMGSISGANLWQYVLSRMIAGFATGNIPELRFRNNVAVAASSALVGTLIAQFSLMFVAPPRLLGPFIGATIGSAMYNAVIAMLLSIVLNRVFAVPRYERL